MTPPSMIAPATHNDDRAAKRIHLRPHQTAVGEPQRVIRRQAGSEQSTLCGPDTVIVIQGRHSDKSRACRSLRPVSATESQLTRRDRGDRRLCATTYGFVSPTWMSLCVPATHGTADSANFLSLGQRYGPIVSEALSLVGERGSDYIVVLGPLQLLDSAPRAVGN